MSRLARIGSSAMVLVFLLVPAQALGAADLSVSLTAKPTSLALGGPETTELVLSVSNTGPDPAENVSGASTIGTPQLAFFGFTGISQGFSVFSVPADPPLTFNFGTIAPGVTATLKWVENDIQSGLATLTANATTPTVESELSDNSASAQVDVLALVSSTSSLSFGEQTIGEVGPPATVTFTNRAAIPIQISHALAGVGFALAADGCSGTNLAAGASCQVSSSFAPHAPGTLSGSLTVLSETANVSPLAIALSGTGKPADVTPASLLLTRVPKSIKARNFRKGFAVRIIPSEAVALDIELLGRARSGALASAFDLQLFSRTLPSAASPRTVKVKPRGKLLGRLRKKIKVQLKVIATDAAGNSSTATRSIAVKPSRRR